MFRKKTYRFGRWRAWDHTVDAAAQDFISRFLLEPHILLASSPTYASIDLAANKRNVHKGGLDGRNPEQAEYATITEFQAEGYHLDFCVDERLPKGAFALIYDVAPDGGEPAPEDLEPVPLEDSPDDVVLESEPAQQGRESA